MGSVINCVALAAQPLSSSRHSSGSTARPSRRCFLAIVRKDFFMSDPQKDGKYMCRLAFCRRSVAVCRAPFLVPYQAKRKRAAKGLKNLSRFGRILARSSVFRWLSAETASTRNYEPEETRDEARR